MLTSWDAKSTNGSPVLSWAVIPKFEICLALNWLKAIKRAVEVFALRIRELFPVFFSSVELGFNAFYKSKIKTTSGFFPWRMHT